MVFEGLFAMVEFPHNLSDEKMESIFSHSSDTTHLPLEDAPESFDVIRMNISSHILSAIMVDVLMTEGSLRNTPIHLEAIRVELAFFASLAFDDAKQDLDLKFP